MTELAVLLFCAALVTKLVDYVKSIFDKNVTGGNLARILIWTGLSFGLGIAIAFTIPLNMFAALGISTTVEWGAQLLTGVAIGAGGSVLYDLLDGRS